MRVKKATTNNPCDSDFPNQEYLFESMTLLA